jgi:outer membrane protein OmpA-like peptidoglycan-associated protein
VVFIPRHEVTYYVDAQEQVLRRDLAGTGASVERRGKLLVIELPSDVNFAFDKYDIQPRFLPVLNSVARTLNRFPATYIDVVGHTDAIGTDGYNQRLSERRASSVAGYLVHRRADPDRLFVAGEGEHEPVASNASITGRAANRRVEIILTPHEG